MWFCVCQESFIKTQLYAAREMFTRSHNHYGHKAEAAAHPDQVFSDTCRQLNRLLPVTYICMWQSGSLHFPLSPMSSWIKPALFLWNQVSNALWGNQARTLQMSDVASFASLPTWFQDGPPQGQLVVVYGDKASVELWPLRLFHPAWGCWEWWAVIIQSRDPVGTKTALQGS